MALHHQTSSRGPLRGGEAPAEPHSPAARQEPRPPEGRESLLTLHEDTMTANGKVALITRARSGLRRGAALALFREGYALGLARRRAPAPGPAIAPPGAG